MGSSKFEQDFKNRITQYESPMDLDQFWLELEPKLKKKKRRYGLIIIFLFFAGLSGIYFHGTNKNIEDKKPVSEEIIKREHIVTQNTDEYEKFKSIKKEVKTAGDLQNEQDEKHAKLNTSLLYNQPGGIYPKKKNLKNSTPLTPNASKDLSGNSVVPLKGAIIGNSKSSQQIDPGDSELDLYIDQGSIKNNSTKIQTPEQNTFEFPALKSISCDHLVYYREKIEIMPLLLKENIIFKKSKSQNISLLPFAGIGWYTKKLHALSNDPLEDYLKLRDQHEKEIEEINFGLHIRKQFGKIGLFSGMEYKRMNEKFYFEEILHKYQFGTTTIRIEHTDTSYIGSGQAWYKTQLIRKLTNYNAVQQWNIPMGVSYQVLKKTLGLYISAGLMCSISNQITGKSLDKSLKIVEWGQSGELHYSKNLGLGWFGELSVEFPLTRHLAWTSGFKIQEFPGNYSSNQGIDLRYRSYYFSSGIQIRL